MDAVVTTSNGQVKHQQHRNNEGRPDMLATLASRVESLSTAATAFPLWSKTYGDFAALRFAVPVKTLCDFARKCPRKDVPRDLPAALVQDFYDKRVVTDIYVTGEPSETLSEEELKKFRTEELKKLGDSLVADHQVRRFSALLQIANNVDAGIYLLTRATVKRFFGFAGIVIPKALNETIVRCESWRVANGGYSAEDYLNAGYEQKASNPGQQVFAHPLSGESVTVYPKRADYTPKVSNDRRGRHSFGGTTREERGRNEMLAPFAALDPENQRPEKHNKIPKQTREQMEANRLAKVNGRLARRAAAHKAAADRKQEQRAAKKAAGEKKGGKRAQGGK